MAERGGIALAAPGPAGELRAVWGQKPANVPRGSLCLSRSPCAQSLREAPTSRRNSLHRARGDFPTPLPNSNCRFFVPDDGKTLGAWRPFRRRWCFGPAAGKADFRRMPSGCTSQNGQCGTFAALRVPPGNTRNPARGDPRWCHCEFHLPLFINFFFPQKLEFRFLCTPCSAYKCVSY